MFEEDDLIDKLGHDVLRFALDVGLLSQASAPGSFDEENVSINFFHKTVEEFLAALYIACSDEVSVDSFLASCYSIQCLLELENVMAFLLGLDPILGNKLLTLTKTLSDIDSYLTGMNARKRRKWS